MYIRFMLKNDHYKKTIPHSNTRAAQNNNVVVPLTRVSTTRRHISYIGPKTFIMLPDKIRSKTYKNVKRNIYQWIAFNNTTYTDI